jgi:hypothetical protein
MTNCTLPPRTATPEIIRALTRSLPPSRSFTVASADRMSRSVISAMVDLRLGQ